MTWRSASARGGLRAPGEPAGAAGGGLRGARGEAPGREPLPMAGFWVLHIGWSALICAERHHLRPAATA